MKPCYWKLGCSGDTDGLLYFHFRLIFKVGLYVSEKEKCSLLKSAAQKSLIRCL
jgi:hypothetical protein